MSVFQSIHKVKSVEVTKVKELRERGVGELIGHHRTLLIFTGEGRVEIDLHSADEQALNFTEMEE